MTKKAKPKPLGFKSTAKPTPQRAHKAGELRVDAVGAYHCDTVLAALANRRALAPNNETLNRLLMEAGERYASHWTLGYRVGVGAQDMNRVCSDGGVPSGLSASESAVSNAQQYQRASQCLGPYFGAVVDAIVLNEEPVESVGRRVSGYGSAKQAIAVAMDRLREGLSRLAALWGMIAIDAGAPQSHIPRHLPDSRPDGSTPSRALRTHRTLAGMS